MEFLGKLDQDKFDARWGDSPITNFESRIGKAVVTVDFDYDYDGVSINSITSDETGEDILPKLRNTKNDVLNKEFDRICEECAE